MSKDVVDLIMQDHREVERLFEELRRDPGKRPLLVPTVSALLMAHSRAEEAEVYPAARREAGETDEVAHGQGEHAEAEQLLVRLAAADTDSPEFEKVLEELVEAVTHHVEDEESTLLPGMRDRLDERRRVELGRAFAASRAEYMGTRPGEASREELLNQARNAGVSGASSMSKKELADQIKKS